MHGTYPNSSSDLLLYAVPLVALLLFGIFRLDTMFFPAKAVRKTGWSGCRVDENGEPMVIDPDGTYAPPRAKRQAWD